MPNDIPAIASIVRDALRENYPTSLYLDIHRWWRDGFLVAALDGHPVGFLAAVLGAGTRYAITGSLGRRPPCARSSSGTATPRAAPETGRSQRRRCTIRIARESGPRSTGTP